jgi:hypothetical protein
MLENSPSARAESANSNYTIFFGPIEAVQVWLPVISAALEWNGKMIGMATTLNQEWLDVISRRLSENMAVPQYLCTCKSFHDVCSVYVGFFEKAIIDYPKDFVEAGSPTSVPPARP